MRQTTDYKKEKSGNKKARNRRDLYFAVALIILWGLVYLAVKLGMIKP